MIRLCSAVLFIKGEVELNSSTTLKTFFRVNPRPLYCEIVDSLPKLVRLATKMMKVEEFAFDTETNSLRVLGPNKYLTVVGISISWGLYDNYYIPLGHKRYEDYERQLKLATIVSYLKPVFEREDVRIIGHNITFDMHVMSRLGIFIKTEDLFCTQTASWICDENVPKGLKDNSAEKLKIEQTRFNDVVKDVPNEVKKEFGLKASNKATFDLTLIDESASYAIDDAFNTWVLYLGFLDLLEHEEMDKIYNKVYVPLLRTIFNMERVGVDIDLERLEEMSAEMSKDMEELEYEMFKIAGVEFNPASSQQLAELLFGYVKPDTVSKKTGKTNKAKVNEHILAVTFNFPVQTVTAGGAPQTNNATLWKLSLADYKVKRKAQGVELCKLLMQYKKIGKLKSAFVDGLKEQMYDDGKVHPSFNITGTDSGRFSCSSPNLQQLPNADDNDKYQIRSLFRGSIDHKTGERKKIISLDYANLEMRILAHFSEDKNLLEMFEAGADTHGSTAVNMFELDCDPNEVKALYPHLRVAAKTINFLLMYGGGAYTLYNKLLEDQESPINLGEKKYLEQYDVRKGEDVAQIYIDRYFTSYSGVADFIKNQKRLAHRHMYVYTLLKRKRRLYDIQSGDYKIVAYCERLSVNSAVQGSAADVVISAQNRIASDPWFEQNRVTMLLQVHDEIVFEAPEEKIEEAIERATRYMEHPFGDDVELNLPLKADSGFGDTYQTAK